jgi:hypothetical protein
MFEWAASEFASQAMAYESWNAISPDEAMRKMRGHASAIAGDVVSFGTTVNCVARGDEVIAFASNTGLMRLVHFDGKVVSFNRSFDDFSLAMNEADAWLKS